MESFQLIYATHKHKIWAPLNPLIFLSQIPIPPRSVLPFFSSHFTTLLTFYYEYLLGL